MYIIAIVCAALYTVVKRGGGKLKQRLQYAELLDQVSFLSGLLKLEMIYTPGGVESNTRRTVQWLVDQRVLCISEDGWVGLSDEEWNCGRENYGMSTQQNAGCTTNNPLLRLYRFLVLSHLAVRGCVLACMRQPFFPGAPRYEHRRPCALGRLGYVCRSAAVLG